jgi:hypothetical protein
MKEYYVGVIVMDLINKITIEDAMNVYQKEGICSTLENGNIVCEIECEDYCDN